MIAYIDANRDRFGVEPICQVLPIAPSTYYAAKHRSPPARALRDEELKAEIRRVHEDNFGVYGARKIWRQLGREGISVARCTVERLMGELGCRARAAARLAGPPRPTRPPLGRLTWWSGTSRQPGQPAVGRRPDLCGHLVGLRRCGFILDAFSRFIVGWQAARSLRTDLALDALEMAIWQRHGDLEGLVHHSDRGSQYLALRSTERLAEAGAVTSVGSGGDSYDNALAETIIGLYKTELVRRRGPWKGIDQVEYATLEWVDWFNHRRLLEPIGHVPPAEFEATYDRREAQSSIDGLKQPSLR